MTTALQGTNPISGAPVGGAQPPQPIAFSGRIEKGLNEQPEPIGVDPNSATLTPEQGRKLNIISE